MTGNYFADTILVHNCDLHARHLWLVSEGRKQVETLRSDPDYFNAKIAGWWVWGLCQWIGRGWCGKHSEWQQLPHLGNAGAGVHRVSESQLTEYFRLLAARLRRVRVCCGDWERVCGPSPTFKLGLTAVFLDPPYDQSERDPNIYAVETPVAADCRRWCRDNGDNPKLRIALCGYAGEGHEELETLGWSVVEWKTNGGYASQGPSSQKNARRERIWFSPACLKSTQPSLFDDCTD